MDVKIWLLSFFFLWVPLCLATIIPICVKHYKTLRGIINYNASMNEFVFKVHLMTLEIMQKLGIRNAGDELDCVLDSEEMTIVLSHYGGKRKFAVEIREYDEFSILKLRGSKFTMGANYLEYKINPFIVKKLDAELVPYSQYER